MMQTKNRRLGHAKEASLALPLHVQPVKTKHRASATASAASRQSNGTGATSARSLGGGRVSSESVGSTISATSAPQRRARPGRNARRARAATGPRVLHAAGELPPADVSPCGVTTALVNAVLAEGALPLGGRVLHGPATAVSRARGQGRTVARAVQLAMLVVLEVAEHVLRDGRPEGPEALALVQSYSSWLASQSQPDVQ